VWDNAGEDNIFFLAGGIAFNILLAAVPFALLLVTGLAYLLNQSAESSAQTVTQLIDRLLPGGYTAGRDLLHGALGEAVRTRGAGGLPERDRVRVVQHAALRVAPERARRRVRHRAGPRHRRGQAVRRADHRWCRR
jgi:hypothetical protein